MATRTVLGCLIEGVRGQSVGTVVGLGVLVLRVDGASLSAAYAVLLDTSPNEPRLGIKGHGAPCPVFGTLHLKTP